MTSFGVLVGISYAYIGSYYLFAPHMAGDAIAVRLYGLASSTVGAWYLLGAIAH